MTTVTNTIALAPLTAYDIKLIQYKEGLYKLQEINRIIGVLEKNLQNPKPSTNNSQESKLAKNNIIIPLLNYVLKLCDGHVFNIHPLIRKQYLALCQFKFYKSQDMNLPATTTFISSNFNFAIVKEDSFKNHHLNIYDQNLQWKLLNYLKKLTLQTLSLYNRKLRQIQLEKTTNCNRPYEVTEINSKFIIDYVEDLIRPTEVSLSLDFAVLIKDRSKDTNLSSFLRLQYQVLDKFAQYFNKKVIITIKDYYNKINQYSNKSSSFNTLPFSEYTLHRIYALLYKSFDLLSMSISMVISVYLPNKNYFYNFKTKLIIKNVYQYEQLLEKIDKISTEYTNQDFCNFRDDLDSFTKNNINLIANDGIGISTIAVLHKEYILKHIRLMDFNLSCVTKWVSVWKYIQDNIETLEKFKDYEEDQLNRMLLERRSVDKLSYLEKVSKKQQKLSDNGNVINSFAASSATSSNHSSRTSSLRQYKLQPEDVRILNTKAHQSVLTSKNYVSNIGAVPISSLPSLSPTNNSKRQYADNNSLNLSIGMSPLSKSSSHPRNSSTDSPLVSRRSSIIDRSATPVKKYMQFTTPNENIELSTTAVNPNTEQTKNILRKTSSVKGRPRSSSLQTVKNTTSSKNYSTSISDIKRSNSLEANDALNQKLVQDAMKKLMGSDLGRHITQSNKSLNSSKSKSPGANRSRSSSVNSDSSMTLKLSSSEQKIPKIVNAMNNNSSRMASPLSTKSKTIGNNHSREKKDYYGNNGERLQFKDPVNSDSTNTQISDKLEENSNNTKDVTSNDNITTNTTESVGSEGSSIVKKVRFIGVPPMLPSENPKPKKQGWYKKPAILHYPPIPPQVNITLKQKYNLEGIVFRKSLRETSEEERKPKTLINLDETIFPKKTSSTHKFGLNLRDKFRSS